MMPALLNRTLLNRTRGEGVTSLKYFYICSGQLAPQKMAKGRVLALAV